VAEVLVIKRNIAGKETWRYRGEVLQWTEKTVLLQAYFDRDDLDVNGLSMVRGDRFVEVYFSDRWFNLFEIHDREQDALKGFYCNITYPAIIGDGEVSYIDLALDLLVFPDGRQKVLDEDEFAQLELGEMDRRRALEALADLQLLFKRYGSELIAFLLQEEQV